MRTKIGERWAEEEVLPTGRVLEALGGVLSSGEHKYVAKKDALNQILMVEKDALRKIGKSNKIDQKSSCGPPITGKTRR